MTKIKVLLLSWWFVAVWGERMVQIGPFDNEQSCNTIKAETRENLHARVSSCWHTQ